MNIKGFILSLLVVGTVSASCMKDGSEDKVERINAEVSAYTNGSSTGFFSDALTEGMLVKLEGDDYYQGFYFSEIEGFSFERGNNYKLRIKQITLAHPPMDGGSVRYELIEVLSKKEADYTKEDITLYVSAQTGEKIIVPDAPKLRGIKIRANENEDWSVVPFNCIDGFKHEEGYDYKLSVVRITLPDSGKPKNGALNVQYSLKEIITKTKTE